MSNVMVHHKPDSPARAEPRSTSSRPSQVALGHGRLFSYGHLHGLTGVLVPVFGDMHLRVDTRRKKSALSRLLMVMNGSCFTYFLMEKQSRIFGVFGGCIFLYHALVLSVSKDSQSPR